MGGGPTSPGTLAPPAASSIYAVSGTVTVAGSPGAANLVADQRVTATTRTYEIASTATTTGPYDIALAASGAWLGTDPHVLAVASSQYPAGADAGIYAITATDAAGTVSTQAANVSMGPFPLDFTLTP